jgi:hypothetical protein
LAVSDSWHHRAVKFLALTLVLESLVSSIAAKLYTAMLRLYQYKIKEEAANYRRAAVPLLWRRAVVKKGE